MMYLTLLKLDRNDIRKHKIVDDYSIHRVVYSLFDNVRDDEEKDHGTKSSGILFANDGGDFHFKKVTILSNRKPLQVIGTIETKIVNPEFLNFKFYRFEILINPTKKNNKTKKIEALRRQDEIKEWFMSKATINGFHVNAESLDIEMLPTVFFEKKNNELTIGVAKIKGFLEVRDKDQFMMAFQNGIGRSKSFGCGLLKVYPIMNK